MTAAATLRERAQTLAELVERRRSVDTELKELTAFKLRLQQVSDAVEALAPVSNANRVLRSLGRTAVPPAGFADLHRKLRTIQTGYAAEHAYILDQANVAPVRDVARTAKALIPTLQSEWRVYGEDRIPGIPGDVLNVLTEIPAFANAVERIRRGLESLRAMLDKLPQGQIDIDKFEIEATAVRTAWVGLDASQLPPEVLQFLKDAGGDGASLGSLTVTIRDWLQHHRLTSAFRIRPAPFKSLS